MNRKQCGNSNMVDKKGDVMNRWVNMVKDGIENRDPTVVGILVALAVIFLTFLIFAFVKRRGSKRQGVLLLGCCDAGKTLLFTRLVNKVYKVTFTSITSNSGNYSLPNTSKTLRVIDLPGHERVRLQMLDNLKDLARAIIFVVDSSSIQKDVKDIAEYLYTVLSDSKISSMAPPVLIACNKQDLTFSKGAKVVQSVLEKEMNTLRVTRSAALQDISTSGNNNTYLGKRNKDFAFSDLKPIRVEFAECSALGKDENSEPDIGQIEDWLVKIA